MPDNFIPLDSIKIARPCPADWDKMNGTETVRFCQTCTKNVYNLSGMTREQAEALIREKEGKLCVHFYQRADGTVLTQDCPVGTNVVRRPLYWLAAGFVAFLISGVAIAQRESNGATEPCPITSYIAQGDRWASLRRMPVVGAVVDRISPKPVGVSTDFQH